MQELSRTIRFCVPFDDERKTATHGESRQRYNTFAGWPSMVGFGAYYELQVRCRGPVNEVTGYMMNISRIDEAVREHAIPIIHRAVKRHMTSPQTPTKPSVADALVEVVWALQSALAGSVSSICLKLTPYHWLTMHAAAQDRVCITQHFEFSAAHRLHVASLSDQDNRRIFGKCNNPNGHGHNYRVQTTVSVPLTSTNLRHQDGADCMTLQDLERIVHQVIIQRFDHKHLNRDTTEFAQINPSVENIAKVCYDLLCEPIADAGARLEHVTIWETEKTSCTYPAPPHAATHV
jgi:6-pyruvoyltetrahydropterin/6-carboxytetrahydropterin synthase